MKSAFRAALPILAVVLLGTAVVTIGGLATDQTGIFPVTGALAAVVAGIVAGLRHWQFMPWLPVAAIIATAGGYMANNSNWMLAGFFAVITLLAWHGLQREKPGSAAAVRH